MIEEDEISRAETEDILDVFHLLLVPTTAAVTHMTNGACEQGDLAQLLKALGTIHLNSVCWPVGNYAPLPNPSEIETISCAIRWLTTIRHSIAHAASAAILSTYAKECRPVLKACVEKLTTWYNSEFPGTPVNENIFEYFQRLMPLKSRGLGLTTDGVRSTVDIVQRDHTAAGNAKKNMLAGWKSWRDAVKDCCDKLQQLENEGKTHIEVLEEKRKGLIHLNYTTKSLVKIRVLPKPAKTPSKDANLVGRLADLVRMLQTQLTGMRFEDKEIRNYQIRVEDTERRNYHIDECYVKVNNGEAPTVTICLNIRVDSTAMSCQEAMDFMDSNIIDDNVVDLIQNNEQVATCLRNAGVDSYQVSKHCVMFVLAFGDEAKKTRFTEELLDQTKVQLEEVVHEIIYQTLLNATISKNTEHDKNLSVLTQTEVRNAVQLSWDLSPPASMPTLTISRSDETDTGFEVTTDLMEMLEDGLLKVVEMQKTGREDGLEETLYTLVETDAGYLIRKQLAGLKFLAESDTVPEEAAEEEFFDARAQAQELSTGHSSASGPPSQAADSSSQYTDATSASSTEYVPTCTTLSTELSAGEDGEESDKSAMLSTCLSDNISGDKSHILEESSPSEGDRSLASASFENSRSIGTRLQAVEEDGDSRARSQSPTADRTRTSSPEGYDEYEDSRARSQSPTADRTRTSSPEGYDEYEDSRARSQSPTADRTRTSSPEGYDEYEDSRVSGPSRTGDRSRTSSPEGYEDHEDCRTRSLSPTPSRGRARSRTPDGYRARSLSGDGREVSPGLPSMLTDEGKEPACHKKEATEREDGLLEVRPDPEGPLSEAGDV